MGVILISTRGQENILPVYMLNKLAQKMWYQITAAKFDVKIVLLNIKNRGPHSAQLARGFLKYEKINYAMTHGRLFLFQQGINHIFSMNIF